MPPETSLEPRQDATFLQELVQSKKTVPTVSVLMPVYNEGFAVVPAIQSAIEKFESLLSPSFEMIVVDDGSTDNTREALDSIRDDRVTVVSYPKNSGKGGALLFAFKFAKAPAVIFADGDMEAFPYDLRHYMDALQSVDIAIASKRVRGAQFNSSLKRNFLSIGFNNFVRFFLGLSLKDTQAGFKVFRRSALEKIVPLISVRRYAFDVELLVVATKIYHLRVAELPARVRLDGGFRLGHILRMLIDILGIGYRLRVKHWYQNNHNKPHEEYRPLLRW